MPNGTTNELYEKAKELVPNVDKEIKKLKDSGECLTSHEALNLILRKYSRENIGKEELDGHWIKMSETRRGNNMGYMLVNRTVRTIFFEEIPEDIPEQFAPVRVKVNIIRNRVSNIESLEYVGHRKGKLTLSDLMLNLQRPATIDGDSQPYIIAGKITFVNRIGYEKGQKLDKPKPLFEVGKDGKRVANIRLSVADLEQAESYVGVTVRDPDIISKIYGVKTIKMLHHLESVPTEEKREEKLKNALTKKVIVFGYGSNINPSNAEAKTARPYLTIGNVGFMLLYDNIFGSIEKDISNSMDEVEKEVAQEGAKAELEDETPVNKKKMTAWITKMAEKGKASKKLIKKYVKKKGYNPHAAQVVIEKMIKTKVVKVDGEKLVLIKKQEPDKKKAKTEKPKK